MVKKSNGGYDKLLNDLSNKVLANDTDFSKFAEIQKTDKNDNLTGGFNMTPFVSALVILATKITSDYSKNKKISKKIGGQDNLMQARLQDMLSMNGVQQGGEKTSFADKLQNILTMRGGENKVFEAMKGLYENDSMLSMGNNKLGKAFGELISGGKGKGKSKSKGKGKGKGKKQGGEGEESIMQKINEIGEMPEMPEMREMGGEMDGEMGEMNKQQEQGMGGGKKRASKKVPKVQKKASKKVKGGEMEMFDAQMKKELESFQQEFSGGKKKRNRK